MRCWSGWLVPADLTVPGSFFGTQRCAIVYSCFWLPLIVFCLECILQELLNLFENTISPGQSRHGPFTRAQWIPRSQCFRSIYSSYRISKSFTLPSLSCNWFYRHHWPQRIYLFQRHSVSTASALHWSSQVLHADFLIKHFIDRKRCI